MKKTTTKFALVFIMFNMALGLEAQVCWLAKDSVFQGKDSSAYALYNYQAGLLRSIDYIDSGNTTVKTVDSIYYGSHGKQTVLKAFDPNGSTPFKVTTLSYDSNDNVIRVHILEDNGFGPNTVAHDITYNASNEISSIIVDPSSIVGTTDAFNWNFENIVWLNGNIQSLDLVGDITGAGMDTIEFAVNYDNMLNIRRLLPIDDVGGLIEQISANNIETLVTLNDEILGPAGTNALDRSYTYFTSGEVSSMEEKVALFNDNGFKVGFRFDCSGIGLEEKNNLNLSVYPNPAKDAVFIKSSLEIISLKLYSLNGQLLLNQVNYDASNGLSLQGIPSGVFVLEVQGEQFSERLKLVLE